MGELKERGAPHVAIRFSPPAPLADHHDRSAFDSASPELDTWLHQWAHRSEGVSARTYVVCCGQVVAGYYCIATGSLERREMPGSRQRRGLPDPIPVIILGRLAVDSRFGGRGLGSGLLADAMRRSVALSRVVGVRALIVHALENAASFYRKYGFVDAAITERTLILPIETAMRELS